MKPSTLRLGEVLEQRGRLAHEQTLRALRNQKVLGGRLGTCLLEIDAISEEELLSVLADMHGVSPAYPEDLRNIPADLIALLPEKVARRCMAVPFYSTSTQIKVALLNPRDLAVQDEIAFVLGKRVRWHIAIEVRIQEALERYYGLEAPTRTTKLLDRLNRNRFMWARESAATAAAAAAETEELGLPPALEPVAPLAPPAVLTPVPAEAPKPLPEPAPALAPPPPLPAAPPPAPPVVAVAPPPLPAATAPPAANPLAPVAPVAPLSANVPSAAASPVPSVVPPPAAAPAPEPPGDDDTQDLVDSASHRGPISLADAEQFLLEPKDRDDVARTLLDFAATRARRALMLVARKQELAAWLWCGEGLDGPRLAAFRTTLDEPSIFASLHKGADIFRGALPPVPAHSSLLAAFVPPPGAGVELVAWPLRVRGRMVAVLLAEPPGEAFDGGTLAEFGRIAAKAAIAFELCIMRAKLKKA